jgi:predicted O-linked N-acetylglucosamine transferase (SPINDLY family)
LLESRDRTNFVSFCYLTLSFKKDYPSQLSGLVENIRDLRNKSVEEIARKISDDHIDILVNLSWAQRYVHLMVFSQRPAPIQIEVPVYPGTTGLPETDCVFTDEWICPWGSESMYSERAYRLKASYMPWQPPSKAPPVSPAPIARSGRCTFGYFQKSIKLNRGSWDAIAGVLRAVPGSRLLFHQRSRDIDDPTSDSRIRYLYEMAKRGIDENRLIFIGGRPTSEHYKIVARADIALDSFPYNGTTTTGDCLWMGVPVITLAGETHAGRVGLSMLSRVGLEELVATSIPEYIEKAVLLANHPERLTQLRSELRARMRGSDVTNGRKVMAGIEEAYRALWMEHCKKGANT